jgi:hypothetical protein
MVASVRSAIAALLPMAPNEHNCLQTRCAVQSRDRKGAFTALKYAAIPKAVNHPGDGDCRPNPAVLTTREAN